MKDSTIGDAISDWEGYDQFSEDDELRDSLIQEGRFNTLPSFRRVKASLVSCSRIEINSKEENQIGNKSSMNTNANKNNYGKCYLFSCQESLSYILPFLNVKELLSILEIYQTIDQKLERQFQQKPLKAHINKTRLSKGSNLCEQNKQINQQQHPQQEKQLLSQQRSQLNAKQEQETFHVRFGVLKRSLAQVLSIRLCECKEEIRMEDIHKFFYAFLKMDILLKLFPLTFTRLSRNRSVYEPDIQRDAERTFTNNIDKNKMEITQKTAQLNQILIAVSQSVKEIGYIQGWNMIVATLIKCRFSSQLQFWLFNYLMKCMKLKLLYLNDFNYSHFLNYAFDIFVQNYLPDLHQFLKLHELELSYFSTSWFLSLFSIDLAPQTAVKVWMLVCLKGWKYLVKVALSIIIMTKDRLMQCADEEEINQILKKQLVDYIMLHENQLFSVAKSIKVTNTLLQRLFILFCNNKTSSSSKLQIRKHSEQQQVQIKQIYISANKLKTVLQLKNNSQENKQDNKYCQQPNQNQISSLNGVINTGSQIETHSNDNSILKKSKNSNSEAQIHSSSPKKGIIDNLVTYFENKWSKQSTAETFDSNLPNLKISSSNNILLQSTPKLNRNCSKDYYNGTQVSTNYSKSYSQNKNSFNGSHLQSAENPTIKQKSNCQQIIQFNLVDDEQPKNSRKNSEIGCEVPAEELMIEDDDHHVKKDQDNITKIDSNTSLNEEEDYSISGFKSIDPAHKNTPQGHQLSHNYEKNNQQKHQDCQFKKEEDTFCEINKSKNDKSETQSFFQKIINIFKPKEKQPLFFGNSNILSDTVTSTEGMQRRLGRNKSHDISVKTHAILLTEPAEKFSPFITTSTHSRQSSLVVQDQKQLKTLPNFIQPQSNKQQATFPLSKNTPPHHQNSTTPIFSQQSPIKKQSCEQPVNFNINNKTNAFNNKEEQQPTSIFKSTVSNRSKIHKISVLQTQVQQDSQLQKYPLENDFAKNVTQVNSSLIYPQIIKDTSTGKGENFKGPYKNQIIINNNNKQDDNQEEQVSLFNENNDEIYFSVHPHENIKPPSNNKEIACMLNIGNKTKEQNQQNSDCGIISVNSSIEHPHTPPHFISVQKSRDWYSTSSSQSSFPTFTKTQNSRNKLPFSNQQGTQNNRGTTSSNKDFNIKSTANKAYFPSQAQSFQLYTEKSNHIIQSQEILKSTLGCNGQDFGGKEKMKENTRYLASQQGEIIQKQINHQ